MLLLTLVDDINREKIMENIEGMREYFQVRNIIIGISESIEANTHFIKIFCDDESIKEKFLSTFNLYMANIIYDVLIEEFCKNQIEEFLSETYFFLKYEEINEVKDRSTRALRSKETVVDENSIYYINRKNEVVNKILECIQENKQINIKGFITFRMKEIKETLEEVIDKVVERYMVDKEYDEFIKLLKYFVEIQESKIDEVNIIVQSDGKFEIRDKNDKDIMEKFLSELSEEKFTGTVSTDDMLISGLITNCPKKIIIHCCENCSNKELIDTIVSVFESRVIFCSDCKICNKVHGIKCKK